MRYNEKELRALSQQPAEMAAELSMRGPKKGSGKRLRAGDGVGTGWGEEMGSPGCAEPRPVPTVAKRRLVKLVVNFLFYFRTDEAEVGT